MSKTWMLFCAGFFLAACAGIVFTVGAPDAAFSVQTFSGPSEERDSIVSWEAQRIGMDSRLAIAISHVENWAGDSAAVHPRSKATGLMQVMPFWADSFVVECYGVQHLTVRRRNACLGVRIAKRYFEECGNWGCAMVAYVGARCLPTDSWERCARKKKAGELYVLEVVERFGRDDLSPARDAMALGEYRAAMGSVQPIRSDSNLAPNSPRGGGAPQP